MPSWTPEQLRDYENRRLSPRTVPEPSVCDGSLAAKEGKTGHTKRILVCSYRTRLLDPDNLCPKYFIDCLRYAEIIENDTPEHVEITVRQVKVKKGQERTEIEII